MNIISWLGLPDSFGEALLAIALALLLCPYFPGVKLGPIQIPSFADKLKKILKFAGPAILLIAFLLYIPWPALQTQLDMYLTLPVDLETTPSTHGFLQYESANRISYKYEKTENHLRITPNFAYAELVRNGAMVNGIEYGKEPFEWEFPALSCKAVNNTKKKIEIVEAVIEVLKSSVDYSPLPFIMEPNINGVLNIINDGWGEIGESKLQLSFFPSSYQGAETDSHSEPHFAASVFIREKSEFPVAELLNSEILSRQFSCSDKIIGLCVGDPPCYCEKVDNLHCNGTDFRFRRNLTGGNRNQDIFYSTFGKTYGFFCESFTDGDPQQLLDMLRSAMQLRIDKDDRDPPSINGIELKKCLMQRELTYLSECDPKSILVRGTLEYVTVHNIKQIFNFSSKVYLGNPFMYAPVKPSFPTHTYSALLLAGVQGETLRIPMSVALSPGDDAHFLLQLGSNRSADFDLHLSFVGADGKVLSDNTIDLSIVTPKSGYRYLAHRERLKFIEETGSNESP